MHPVKQQKKLSIAFNINIKINYRNGMNFFQVFVPQLFSLDSIAMVENNRKKWGKLVDFLNPIWHCG